MWIWSTKMRRVGISKENACWTSPTPRDLHYGKQCKSHKWWGVLVHAWRQACAIHGEKSHVQHTHLHLLELGSQLYPQFPGFRTLQGSSHYATCCCCCCYLGPKKLQLIHLTNCSRIHSELGYPTIDLSPVWFWCVGIIFFPPILRRIRAYHLETLSINK